MVLLQQRNLSNLHITHIIQQINNSINSSTKNKMYGERYDPPNLHAPGKFIAKRRLYPEENLHWKKSFSIGLRGVDFDLSTEYKKTFAGNIPQGFPKQISPRFVPRQPFVIRPSHSQSPPVQPETVQNPPVPEVVKEAPSVAQSLQLPEKEAWQAIVGRQVAEYEHQKMQEQESKKQKIQMYKADLDHHMALQRAQRAAKLREESTELELHKEMQRRLHEGDFLRKQEDILCKAM